MNIEVLDFAPADGTKMRGYAKIRCDAFELNLRICQYKNEKFYVEFPKLFDRNDILKNPIMMADSKNHQVFQKEVIDQIKAKWPRALTFKELADKI